jgi:peptidyl-Lys metalloendopeptidase
MAKSKTPKTHLRVRIYSVPKYSTRSVRVFFEITNKGNEPVSVLKRNTPLEGLLEDCLTVKRNGKALKYDGLHVKRLKVTPEEFSELKPDQSLSREVDLSESYPLAFGGKISVSFKKKLLNVLSGNATTTPAKITGVPANFTVTSALRPTVGDRHREAVPVSESLPSAARPLAVNVNILGATPERETALRRLHDECLEVSKAAFDSLKNDAKYTEWFGTHTSPRARQVLSVYKRIGDNAGQNIFTYDCNPSSKCNSSVAAQTTFGSTTILICEAFWSLPQTGSDTQLGCLLHEHSHASAGTKDFDGGRRDLARQLALSDPNRATNCAYNIEYYAVQEDQPV